MLPLPSREPLPPLLPPSPPAPPAPPALPGPLAPPELFSGDVELPDGGQVTVTDGHVELPEGTMHLPDNAFRDCTALVSVTCPKTLRVIGSHAFYGCTSLARADFNDGLISIGERAFMNTPLIRVTVPPRDSCKLGIEAFPTAHIQYRP